jgi:uncharacterized membrane protein YphA (DoxX/SURF4 family)
MIFADASWLDTAGRLLIVGFFLVAGVLNLAPARIKDHIDRLAAFGVPLPAAAFWFGLALQFTGCALLITGWHAEIGAWCLIVFTVVANALFHRFWTVQDPARRNTLRLMLLNGVAITGGLLLLLQNTR